MHFVLPTCSLILEHFPAREGCLFCYSNEDSSWQALSSVTNSSGDCLYFERPGSMVSLCFIARKIKMGVMSDECPLEPG